MNEDETIETPAERTSGQMESKIGAGHDVPGGRRGASGRPRTSRIREAGATGDLLKVVPIRSAKARHPRKKVLLLDPEVATGETTAPADSALPKGPDLPAIEGEKDIARIPVPTSVPWETTSDWTAPPAFGVPPEIAVPSSPEPSPVPVEIEGAYAGGPEFETVPEAEAPSVRRDVPDVAAPVIVEPTEATEARPDFAESSSKEKASQEAAPWLQASAPVHAAPTGPAYPDTNGHSSARLSRSEMIAARAARQAAMSAARPHGASSEGQSRRPAPHSRPADTARGPGEIFSYWVRVRNGRRFPTRADFNDVSIAENWPNSILLTCGATPGSGGISFSKVLRFGTERVSDTGGPELTFTPTMTEWILSIGGEAAMAGQPVQDVEVFPSSEGANTYRIVALPLGDRQSQVDHVLCQLTRA